MPLGQTSFSLLFLLFLLYVSASSSSITATYNLVGLKNLGETCYANVLFQLLYRNEDFRSGLQDYLNKENGCCPVLVSLNSIFTQMDQAPERSSIIPDTFAALPSGFHRNTQYDSVEVLERYQKIPNFNWNPFKIHLKKHHHGENISKLELFLQIPQEAHHNGNLVDLLTGYFDQSHSRISKLPDNLLIRIKRLKNINGIDRKICRKISIPQDLSLKPFCCNNEIFDQTETEFHLDAFIEHCGKCTDDGHYVLHFRQSKRSGGSFITTTYWSISDEKIQEINHEKFMEKAAQAYIFLYKRARQD